MKLIRNLCMSLLLIAPFLAAQGYTLKAHEPSADKAAVISHASHKSAHHAPLSTSNWHNQLPLLTNQQLSIVMGFGDGLSLGLCKSLRQSLDLEIAYTPNQQLYDVSQNAGYMLLAALIFLTLNNLFLKDH